MYVRRLLTLSAVLLLTLFPAVALLCAAPARAAELTFDRTLNVTGHLELTVATGSGTIHITRGSSNQLHIYGRIHGGWGADESRMRQIAEHPPIEQTGNIVRIGKSLGNLNNISIDYEIQAPENTLLEAASGSGDIKVEAVGQNARLTTGSGDIRATGLRGAFTVSTGSGDIYTEQSGEGEVKAEAGSGNLDLRNLRGSLHASTGSGDIRVTGAPVSSWKLSTGSGDIDLTTGATPVTLEASTGSGNIHADQPFQSIGSVTRHHLDAKINGGGPTVRAETGSGSIRVH